MQRIEDEDLAILGQDVEQDDFLAARMLGDAAIAAAIVIAVTDDARADAIDVEIAEGYPPESNDDDGD